MSYYVPEIGQFFFGRPWQEHECPEWLLAYFILIEEELCRVRGNIEQREYDSPFANTGNTFENEVFAVEAYSWDEDAEQEWNFRWRGLRVSWYKHMRHGTTVNYIPSPEEALEMLNECLKSLWDEEDKQGGSDDE